MNPSTRIGKGCLPASSMAPTRAAISKPPTAANRLVGSSLKVRCACMARCTMSRLCINRASSTPVPRPVTSSADALIITPRSTLADVVLPMPISPSPIHSTPSSTACLTRIAPICMACSHCSVVIAGALTKLMVPFAILFDTTFASEDKSAATPTSMTSSCAPALALKTQTAAPPAAKLCIICAVTSRGKALTPSCAMP